MDPEEEAFGPYVHGASVILLPRQTDVASVRATYLEGLDHLQLPYSDTPSNDSAPQDVSQQPVASRFLHYDGGIAIYHPHGGEHTAQGISGLSSKEVVLVQPLGKARIWTYVLYRNGHLMDRHASCPEWIPEDYLGDPDFNDYERIHGRAKALRDYMDTWQGDGRMISDLFEAERSTVEPYLRQFTLAELSEWQEMRKKYSEHKVRSEDRFSIASPWVLVHFIEQLGFSGFRDDYWYEERCEGRQAASPVF